MICVQEFISHGMHVGEIMTAGDEFNKSTHVTTGTHKMTKNSVHCAFSMKVLEQSIIFTAGS